MKLKFYSKAAARLLVLIGLSSAAAVAGAAPIAWTISQGTFDDGGHLYGNFTTDIVGGRLSVLDFDVITTAGNTPNGYGITRSGYEYRSSGPGAPFPKVTARADHFGDQSNLSSLFFAYESSFQLYEFFLNLEFTYDLDAAHLQNSLYRNSTTGVWNTYECDNCGKLRNISGAESIAVTGRETPPVTTSVPEPTSIALVAGALAGMVGARRSVKQRKAQP